MPAVPHDHNDFVQTHVFLGRGHARAESRAKWVAVLTFAFMLVEVAAGLWTGSMALLADGIHMATHAGALGLAAFSYFLARRYATDARFSFGSGKFGDLAAFTNAVLLGVLALIVAAQSLHRLLEPANVAYGDAMLVALIGLGINLVSAVLLHERHDHGHEHGHGHERGHAHALDGHDHDLNLRGAYLHVLADALTSVLALAALGAGLYFGIGWADSLAGIAGAIMIGLWSVGLLRDSALVLLDAEDDPGLAAAIKGEVEREFALTICDFHLWRLGPGHRGLIVSLVGATPADTETVKQRLIARHPSLSHVTVETVVCPACAAGKQ
jgi:cation diffusion facilitator family transporter